MEASEYAARRADDDEHTKQKQFCAARHPRTLPLLKTSDVLLMMQLAQDWYRCDAADLLRPQAGVGISYFVTERSTVAKLLQTEQPEPLTPAPA
jgi:hypothetical protein